MWTNSSKNSATMKSNDSTINSWYYRGIEQKITRLPQKLSSLHTTGCCSLYWYTPPPSILYSFSSLDIFIYYIELNFHFIYSENEMNFVACCWGFCNGFLFLQSTQQLVSAILRRSEEIVMCGRYLTTPRTSLRRSVWSRPHLSTVNRPTGQGITSFSIVK